MFSTLLRTIDVSPTAPPGVADKVSQLLGYLAWAGGAICVAALIVGGITVMLAAMGRGGDGAERVVRVAGLVFIGALLVAGASALGAALVPGV